MTDAGVTTQVHQILIRASPERIWAAITRPEFTERYFYGVRVETSGTPGMPFRHRLGDRLVIDETVLEADAPNRLVVSWRPLYDAELAAEPASRVSFVIEEQHAGVCVLTVVHDRLEHSPGTARNVAGLGWTTVLSGMKTLLETGESLFA